MKRMADWSKGLAASWSWPWPSPGYCAPPHARDGQASAEQEQPFLGNGTALGRRAEGAGSPSGFPGAPQRTAQARTHESCCNADRNGGRISRL